MQITAQHDPVVALTFMKVANLFLPPPDLLRPHIIWRILRGNLPLTRVWQ